MFRFVGKQVDIFHLKWKCGTAVKNKNFERVPIIH
jgi:hypothetical protein